MEHSDMTTSRRVVLGAAALGALLPWSSVARAADSRLYVIAELVAKAGQEATLRAGLVRAAQAAPKEPGCIAYELLEDDTRPGRFLTFETWIDEAALTAHLNSPAMKAAGPRLEAILETPFALTRLKRLV